MFEIKTSKNKKVINKIIIFIYRIGKENITIDSIDKENITQDKMTISDNLLSFFTINSLTGEIKSFSYSESLNFSQNKEILKKFLNNFIKKDTNDAMKLYNFKTIYLSKIIIQRFYNAYSNNIFVGIFNKGVTSYQRNLFFLHIFFAYKNIYLKLSKHLENNEDLFSYIFHEILLGPLIHNFDNAYMQLSKKIDLILFENSEYLTSILIDLETNEIICDIGDLLYKNYKISLLQLKNYQKIINELCFHGLNLKNNYLKSIDKNIDLNFNSLKIELRSTFPRDLFFIKFLPILQGTIIVHVFNQFKMAKVKIYDQKHPNVLVCDAYKEIDFAYYNLLEQIGKNNTFQINLIEKFYFEYFLLLKNNCKEIGTKQNLQHLSIMKIKNIDYNLIYFTKDILKIFKDIIMEYYKDENDLLYKLKKKLKEENDKINNNQLIEKKLSSKVLNASKKNPLELGYNNFIKNFKFIELNHKLKSNEILGLNDINLYFSEFSNINEFSELNLTKENLNIIKRNIVDKNYNNDEDDSEFNVYKNVNINYNQKNSVDVKNIKSESEDKDDNLNTYEPFKSDATNIGFKGDFSQDESVFKTIVSLRK